MSPLQSIEQLRQWWQLHTRPGARRLCLALLVAAVVVAALLARQGLPWSRAAALAALVVGVVPTVWRVMWLRRQQRDERAVMEATVMRTEPQVATALLRAMALSEATAVDARRGSAELAQLHVARTFGRIDRRALGQRAERSAWLSSAVALLAAVLALGVVLLDPMRLVEGADVLFARDGVAPVTIGWVERSLVEVEPPAYLGMPAVRIQPDGASAQFAGSEVTVRAQARYDGRELVLTDGVRQVPFVSDGEGAVVARWKLERDASLKVAARFGGVRIEAPETIDLHAVPDYHPSVRLKGAPQRHRLLAIKRIPIHWEASDDHGLREVAVVLRAGEREERREVSKPRGGGTEDRGGIDLLADDPFLQRSYLPVEVTVQALDNDAETGPKWGVSEPMTLLPPAIGEREAMRYRALRRARDQLAVWLADRLEEGAPAANDAERYRERERARNKELLRVVDEALDGRLPELGDSVAPVALRGALAALLLGQREKLLEASKKAMQRPGDKGHEVLIAQNESTLLAADAALGALGARDTRDSAAKLAEVATDALEAMALAGEPHQRARAEARLAADVQVLQEGGRHLLELGALGRDIGETVGNHLGRVRRSWDGGDRFHARLAMQDLLARLRQPDPAMSSSGGRGGGHGHGVEAGGQAGAPQEQPASQAAEQADEVADALEQLRQEHAAEKEATQQTLDDALTEPQRQQLQETLNEYAKGMRESVDKLPQQANDPESARSDAARARAQAEAAASALERGDVEEAMRRGQEAMESLGSAKQKGDRAEPGGAESQVGQQATSASDKLGELMRGAQRALKKSQGEASKQAAGKLRSIGNQVSELADRARQLGQRSAASDAPLPQSMLEKLRQAAEQMKRASEALKQGKGEEALKRQREAQRLLEMAQPEREREPAGSGDGGSQTAKDADVPPEARSREAEQFRKRVSDGLGKDAPPHLQEALRRYTEGLLR